MVLFIPSDLWPGWVVIKLSNHPNWSWSKVRSIVSSCVTSAFHLITLCSMVPGSPYTNVGLQKLESRVTNYYKALLSFHLSIIYPRRHFSIFLHSLILHTSSLLLIFCLPTGNQFSILINIDYWSVQHNYSSCGHIAIENNL